MNALAFTAGAIIGGIIWALISYAVIRFLFTIEDNTADRARHRARRRFREEEPE